MPKPSIGRIVHYTLSEHDANLIKHRRQLAVALLADPGKAPGGTVLAAGNGVSEGDVFPMVITRVWNEDPGTVNGQVLLDGNDALWVTSVMPGEGSCHYAWPTRD